MTNKEELLADIEKRLAEGHTLDQVIVKFNDKEFTLGDVKKALEEETEFGKFLIEKLSKEKENFEKYKTYVEESRKARHQLLVNPPWWDKMTKHERDPLMLMLYAIRFASAYTYLQEQEQPEEVLDEFLRWYNQKEGEEVEIPVTCAYQLDYIMRRNGWKNEEEEDTTSEGEEENS